MHTPALRLHQLTKRYRGTQVNALDSVSLSVQSGEVYGFLGSNGAGKSTTIRSILNFIQPTKGGISVLGLDSVADSVKAKQHIGYLAGEIALYGGMTGNEFLRYMQALQPLKHPTYYRQIVKRFELDLTKPIHTLSKGNRQKVGIIQALMHEPEVLILDEPTSGLDPLMQDIFFACIIEAKQRGCAIFASSHNFSEVQRMCDRVGFLKNGKLVSEQSLTDLTKQAAHTFTITFVGEAPMEELQRVPGLKVISHSDQHATIVLQGELTPLLLTLAHHRVVSLTQQEIDLEETFLQFYRNDKEAV